MGVTPPWRPVGAMSPGPQRSPDEDQFGDLRHGGRGGSAAGAVAGAVLNRGSATGEKTAHGWGWCTGWYRMTKKGIYIYIVV